MRFLNFTLIKLCLAYVFGIYVGFFDVLSLNLLLLLFLSFIILLVTFRWVWKIKSIFFYLSILLFALLGHITTYLHLPQHQNTHLINFELNNDTAVSLYARVDEVLKPNAFNHKIILSDLYIKNQGYKGKILWHVSKDIDVSTLMVGQEVWLYTALTPFQSSKNPQSFDYAGFMHNRDVYAVAYEDHFVVGSESNYRLRALGASQRQKIVIALEKSGFKQNHLQLMQALILGQKQVIDSETYNDFAEVGVVHILAVSGLHVGIVLFILQFLLRPLRRIKKYGWVLIVLFSILGLWSFAALAGFSPSVMRASTMFSFLALGQLFRRKTNSLNLLCLSALVLLLFRPQLFFEVGFQLSYAAVFSIVMLYPVFSKLYLPKSKIPKILVETAYVSLAAQIGVLPFQLFYFHQFPGLFLVGNIAVIPLLGVLLSGGIICIFLALLGILFSPIVKLYSACLDVLISFVDWLSAFKFFLFQDIFFTKSMFIANVLLIFTFIIMIREFKIKQILVCLCAITVFAVVSIFDISKVQDRSELIIFHKSKQTLIGVKQGQTLAIYSDTIALQDKPYWLKNYKLLNRVRHIKQHRLKNFYKMQEEHLIVIDSSGVYLDRPQNNVVLITGSPDIHLEKLINNLKPKKIIADGNNYKSYVERWLQTSEEYNVPFHSTYRKGALKFNLH